MNIGEQINNLRKQHGLSQDDFVNLFNVSRQTISNWENGKSYPDLEMIIKVNDYFKISIDELLKNDVQTVKKLIMKKRQKRSISYYCQFYVFQELLLSGDYTANIKIAQRLILQWKNMKLIKAMKQKNRL